MVRSNQSDGCLDPNVSGLIPVVHFTEIDQVKPYLELLLACGVSTIEVTLRGNDSLKMLEAAIAFRDNKANIVGAGSAVGTEGEGTEGTSALSVGVGTILTEAQLRQVSDLSVDYALSPGIDVHLMQLATHLQLPFIPGVATASEIMLGLKHHIRHFKLFPAMICGGVSALKAFSGPFPEVKFCPTGGVSLDNFGTFLMLDNVFAVGGTWVADKNLMAAGEWDQLKQRLLQAKEVQRAHSQ